jgi:ribosome-binding factor A
MRAGFHRTDRIAALLRREIGALVHDAVREKLIPSVSVCDVEVTRDLAHATIYVTALLGEQGRPAVKELNEAAWEFRRELAHRVDLRTVPALHFKYDDSVDRGERIEALLRAPTPAPAEAPAKPRAPRKVAAPAKSAPAKKSPAGSKTAAARKSAVAKAAAPAKKRAPRKTTD